MIVTYIKKIMHSLILCDSYVNSRELIQMFLISQVSGLVKI